MILFNDFKTSLHFEGCVPGGAKAQEKGEQRKHRQQNILLRQRHQLLGQ